MTEPNEETSAPVSDATDAGIVDESDAAVPEVEEAPESLLFRFVIFASAAFVITVLIMSVASFSDSTSPIPVFFNAHGLKVVCVEVALILCLGLSAMIVDRRQTLAWQERLHQKRVERGNRLANEIGKSDEAANKP